jgi:transposase
MATRHPKIPAEIEAELSPQARRFFTDLIDDYERRLADKQQLVARVAELENAIVKLTPQNSSLPPSTQHPHAKVPPKPKRKSKSRKKQGAQPGHRRATRPLIPTEDCDDVQSLVPTSCRKCQQALLGQDANPLRHQLFELPEIKPHVTEYQRHRLTCECCGTQTCAELPTGVPEHQCGPRLAAFTGLLLGHFRQSKRRAAMFLSDLLKVPCSPGWIVKIQNHVSNALGHPYEEVRQELAKQPQLFVDESPTKQHRHKAWLWVAVAANFAVFGIYLNRKRESLRALIGNYAGMIINCDRAKMYYDGTLQWCWAHLKRDIQKLIDSSNGQEKRLGHDLMRQLRMLFNLWHDYQAGHKSWRAFQLSVAPIRREFNSLLLRGKFAGIGMATELCNHKEWLWTFTKVRGIEPTNNAAERALRPAVIYRKLSFGTQSAAGSRFIERMLTVTETCRMQNRSSFAYLVAAMEAYYRKQPLPSLLITKKPAKKSPPKTA